MSIAERLTELGIVLPAPMPPAGSYEPAVSCGDLLYVSGHGPVDGDRMVVGKVGAEVDLAAARDAARMTGLSLLATLDARPGGLDRVVRIVKLFGMVNAAPGFVHLPAVIDGCSDLLVEVFGDAGRHARTAVAMAELPFGIAVEIELVVQIAPD